MTNLFFTIFVVFFQFVALPTMAQEEDPFDVQLGEKLFLEDRFAQSFFQQFNGDTNAPTQNGDPVLDILEMTKGEFAHPEKGRHVSCSSCHFVDQATKLDDRFVLTYNDFATRTKVPLRDDQQKRTVRNSMNMVLSSVEDGRPLHWDGEFFSAKDLASASLVGRNMGWKPDEAALARDHIVKVIRTDDGTYPGTSAISESYETSFEKLGFNLSERSNAQVFAKTSEIIAAYLKSIDFSRDNTGDFNLSAYDQFLQNNGLNRRPKLGQSNRDYLQYLRDHLNYKRDWKWVEPQELKYHEHTSKFGPLELQGMTVFFTRGQCISCHTPPNFTDSGFHATGISQLEYDQVHGKEAFTKLAVPGVDQRKKHPEKYLIATENNPHWQSPFRQVPKKDQPGLADLGVWNMLGHPDKGNIQDQLKTTICRSLKMPVCNWSESEYLKKSFAMFKTPTLRSLGQSAPYFHNGSSPSLSRVLAIYMATAHLARKGRLLNADPMLRAVDIRPEDFEALEAFMNTLDEDYD